MGMRTALVYSGMLLTFVRYASKRDAMFMSLMATMSSFSSFKKRKSLPPKLKSLSSATLIGVLTTVSGSYVSSSKNSLK